VASPANVRVTFSTTKLTPSAFVSTGYKHTNWRAVHLDRLKPADRERVFRWVCENVHAPFNSCGYYWNFMPMASCCTACAYDADGDAFYCAEQITTAMRVANAHPIFSHARPYECTPDDVYAMLTSSAGYPRLTITMQPKRRELAKFSLRQESRNRASAATGGIVTRLDGPSYSQREDVAIDVDDDITGDEGDGCCFSCVSSLVSWMCLCSCCFACASAESDRAESAWQRNVIKNV
jgi:hypothetical protein